MKSRTALNLVRACLLSAFLLLAFFVILCLALAVQAAPGEKAAKPVLPVVKPVVKPTVMIGQPYRVEQRRKMRRPSGPHPAKPFILIVGDSIVE